MTTPMKAGSRKHKAVLYIKDRIDDCEHDMVWLIQHGTEEGQTYQQIHDGLALLNSQRKQLAERLAELYEE